MLRNIQDGGFDVCPKQKNYDESHGYFKISTSCSTFVPILAFGVQEFGLSDDNSVSIKLNGSIF